MARSDVLVSADWAEQNLNTPKTVFVEVDEDTSAYDGGHIEGAVKLDWRKDLQDGVRRDFLNQEQFSDLLSAKGIANDDTVVLYGGNNNWFAAYAYWYFKLYGHQDIKLIDGGRKKWELDGRPLSKDAVNREATQYKAETPTSRSAHSATRSSTPSAARTSSTFVALTSSRARSSLPPTFRRSRRSSVATSPEPSTSRGAPPPTRTAPSSRTTTSPSCTRKGLRRHQGNDRLLPHRRAFEPHLVRPAGDPRQEQRQELRRQLGRIRLTRRRTDRIGSLIMCGAPTQGQTLPAGVDVEKETVITAAFSQLTASPSAAHSCVCSTAPESSRPRSWHREPAISASSPLRASGPCVHCPARATAPPPSLPRARACTTWT